MLKACNACGRPSRSTRCDAHPRRTTTEKGYDGAHRRQRATLAPLVSSGEAVCARCHQPILPGQPWDLDHTDDRTGYLGASHQHCNRAAGASHALGGVSMHEAPTGDSGDVSAREVWF